MFSDHGLGISNNGSFVTCTSDATAQHKPGEIAVLKAREGYRWFRYMKAQEAFAVGQVAEMYQFIDNADVDAAAATTTNILQANSDFTASEFNDETFPSAYVSIDANTGANQTRAIISNRGSTSYLTLDKNWDVALDTTSDYVTYDVNYVALADSDEIPIVMGVAIAAISANQWGWFQVKGFCPLVRCVGTTDAIVAGENLVVSATAGICRGMTNGGSTVDELAMLVGKACHASAAADVAGAGVAAILAIPGN